MTPPQTLARRYTLLRELGLGGQARTHLALDTLTDQHVVVKQLHLAHLDNWKAIELFDRECRILATLDHPSIPSYIDTFHSTPEQGGEHFVLVQEYIEGDTLLELIGRGVRFSEDDILDLLRDTLTILDYLHGLSPPVIHRDIKPANLIRRPDGSWALIDFGAIQAILSEASKLGSTIVGTSGYMAPEQFMGHSAPGTDLYALGATLIHTLSHTHPADIPLVRLRLDYHSLVSCSAGLRTLIDDLTSPQLDERPESAHTALQRLTTLDAPTPTSHAPTTSDKNLSNKTLISMALVSLALLTVAGAVGLIMNASTEAMTVTAIPSDTLLPSEERELRTLELYENLDFIITTKDSRLENTHIKLLGTTPYISAYSKSFNVGIAMLNQSPHAIEELKADVSFIDDRGHTLTTRVIDIHPSFAPTVEPGDRIHASIELPSDKPIVQARIALHSPKLLDPSPPRKPTSVPLTWLAERPSGCDFSARTRAQSPPLPENDSYNPHTLELEIANTGSCSHQVVLLEKRLYNAQGDVVDSEKSYLNATYDPPFSPSDHLLVSLNSHLTESFVSYKVFVVSADLHEPYTPPQ